MTEGWKRGAMGIDGNKGADFLNRGKDDGQKAARDISTEEFKRACDPWDHDTWKPGKVSSGTVLLGMLQRETLGRNHPRPPLLRESMLRRAVLVRASVPS